MNYTIPLRFREISLRQRPVSKPFSWHNMLYDVLPSSDTLTAKAGFSISPSRK